MEFHYIFPLQSTCSSPSGLFRLHFLPLFTRHSYQELKIGQGHILCQWLEIPSTAWVKTFQYTYIYICCLVFFPPAFFLTTLHSIYLPSIKGEMNEPLCPTLPAMLALDELVPAPQFFLFSTAASCFYSKSPPGHAWKTCTRSSFSVFLKKG